ncbi:MAG: fibronectin type III domain-containing protein, partial [Candidatus Hadarchaeales archaeon]
MIYFALILLVLSITPFVQAEEKCPDPEFSGGYGATTNDSGGVSGNWSTWKLGDGTTAMWNVVGNIIDQTSKVVYNTEYELNDPKTGPNPPNCGSGWKGFSDGHGLNWWWGESGSEVEGYSYAEITLNYITHNKVYAAYASVRWYAWTDDFDGSTARSRLIFLLQKPGSTTWDSWIIAEYTPPAPINSGWQDCSLDLKSYLTVSGQYKLRIQSWCHHKGDDSWFDDEDFGWWVDYVHLDVNEDATPPSITLSVSPSKEWYPDNTTITFSWSATDSGGSGLNSSPYAYAMDSTPTNWGTTTSASYSTSNLSEGTHTFYVSARDGGQSMLEPNIATASFTFKVDKTGPSLSKTGGPDGGTWINTTSATFSWSASDSLSGVQGYKYSTDGGTSWTDISSTSYTWSGLSDGTHTFKVRAYDQVGNYSEVSWNFGVDSTAPPAPSVSSSTHPDPNTWYSSSSVSLNWSSTDISGIAGYYWYWGTSSTGSPTNWTTSTSATFTVSSDGTWYFRIKAKNGAGLESSIATFPVKVDSTAPSLSKTGGPENWIDRTSVSFSWSASDATTGIQGYKYSADGGTWTDISSTSYTWSGLSDGTHTFKVRAYDQVGNYSEVSWNFGV